MPEAAISPGHSAPPHNKRSHAWVSYFDRRTTHFDNITTSTTTSSTTAIMATSALPPVMPKMLQYFGRHLIFPVLNDQDAENTTALKYEVLKTTNMTDLVGDLYAQLHGLSEPPPEFAKKRDEVLEKLAKFQEKTNKIQEEGQTIRETSQPTLGMVYANHSTGPSCDLTDKQAGEWLVLVSYTWAIASAGRRSKYPVQWEQCCDLARALIHCVLMRPGAC